MIRCTRFLTEEHRPAGSRGISPLRTLVRDKGASGKYT